MTLLNRITIVLAISALLLITLFFGVTNYIINASFNTYMSENLEKRDADLVDYIENTYQSNGSFSDDVLLNLSHQAMTNNITITIMGQDQTIIWKSSQGMIDGGMMGGMMGGPQKGQYIENSYTVDATNKPTLYVLIGQYESTLLSREDVKFRNSLNNGLIISAVLGIVLATSLGVFLAQNISKPIKNLKEATDRLRYGNLKERVTLDSNTREINDLKDSINYLASTLEEQEQLRKRLTSDVSHELRTPLHALQNQFEAMIDGVFEPTKERIETCNNEVFRLANLVKDLEKLTSLDQTDDKLNKERYPLSEIMLPVIHQFESVVKAKQITIQFEKVNNPDLHIDKDKMTQVMFNLLSNAYDFTEQGGKITVTTRQEQKDAVITVSDTGIGISEQDIKHIFERFYRVEQSRNRETGGAGLGLSIVNSIIQAHNGDINVYSKLNEGTIFTITLPIKHSK
ncbi:sensor histidine kinase [Haloplasma contractile]|uniref:histidine kinase n=1 Tax=Haloplasma contractile SSD-17B TaxID=1033810 RepID=F7PV20_9MOLU|nr:ATP-binding protein [Haloplasma contractile]ERJ11255.1 two-component system OmpR family sensor histidine kinase BaeS protein [Haloplasma contractile SSD-17B]